METKFNSQICTTRSQSEALLKLGLKKETADMAWLRGHEKPVVLSNTFNDKEYGCIPAWSLHRLIKMIPEHLLFSIYVGHLCMNRERVYYADGERVFEAWGNGWTIYDNIINCIEWLIKEGYFNKEYLNKEE